MKEAFSDRIKGPRESHRDRIVELEEKSPSSSVGLDLGIEQRKRKEVHVLRS